MLRRHFINISCNNDIKPNEIWYKTSNNEKFEYDVLVDFMQTAGYGFVNFLVANVQVNDGWWCLRFAKNLNSIGIATTADQVETMLIGVFDNNNLIETNILNITEIKLPNIFLIGGSAFPLCKNLQFITIPDSVTSIGESAFEGCSSLTSVIISNSVTSIGKWAFKDCSSLTSVAIPDSVTSIGKSAFNNCDALTSITIPNSVTSIGDRAFSGCSSLTSITFEGTIEQWNTVSKGTGWDESVLTAVVHCTDGDVAI